jgi:hypothetical protein
MPFLEDIEHAEQFQNEAVMANDAMNTTMFKSVAPNIKELSWKSSKYSHITVSATVIWSSASEGRRKLDIMYRSGSCPSRSNLSQS